MEAMTMAEKLVKTALDEKGAENGTKYVRWYNAAMGSGLSLSAAWCAIFVSWCARQVGIGTKRIPNFAGCTTGRRLFQNLGFWKEKAGYEPKRGDLILFDWDGDATLCEHVGIVTGSDGKKVYTVEGNSGGTVREKSYGKSSKVILGYVHWEEEEDLTKAETQALIDRAMETMEKKLGTQMEQTEKALAARVEALEAKKIYHTAEEIPDWGKAEVTALMAEGILKGDLNGDLKLSEEMLRLLVILKRKEEKGHDSARGV